MTDAVFESLNMLYSSKWFWGIISLILIFFVFGGLITNTVGAVIMPHHNNVITVTPMPTIQLIETGSHATVTSGDKQETNTSPTSTVWKGVTQVKDTSGNIGYSIMYDEWLSAYTESSITFVETLPDGLYPVFIDNGGAPAYGIGYDYYYNRIYSTKGGQNLQKIYLELKEQTLESQYQAIASSASPVVTFYELYGEPAKRTALGGVADASEAVMVQIAWDNLCDGQTPDDLTAALNGFCQLTGYVKQ